MRVLKSDCLKFDPTNAQVCVNEPEFYQAGFMQAGDNPGEWVRYKNPSHIKSVKTDKNPRARVSITSLILNLDKPDINPGKGYKKLSYPESLHARHA